MTRIIHDLEQGSDAWHQFRANHFGASEAAAAMGISPYMTRTELLTMKKSGIAKEFSDFVQSRVLDKGHKIEALARPIVEARIGEDLYPLTCSRGNLSASCDGLTIDDSIGFECKQYSKELFESVCNGIVPEHHLPQVQQCLYVTGASKWIFTVSDGTEENTRSVDVFPDPEYIDTIIKGWAQFEKDLAAFVPVVHAEKPKAEPVKALPALSIQIKGEVSLSNLPRFKEAADAFVAQIRTDLETDQDFADAEANVKFLDEAEKSLELAKKNALAETASIDDLMKTIDHIKDSMRSKRLNLEKLVKSKKEQIKSEIVTKGQDALAAHINALNAEIKPAVISMRGNFAEVIKNKRTVASLHDSVNTELSRCKIEADSIAAGVRKNLALLDKQAPDVKGLFADLRTLALKAPEDFAAVVQNRLAAELARIAKIEADAKAHAEAHAKAQADAQAALAAQPAPIQPPIVLSAETIVVPVATPKFSEKPMPNLSEIASKIAFEYAIDVRTAIAWIVAAVNQYSSRQEAA